MCSDVYDAITEFEVNELQKSQKSNYPENETCFLQIKIIIHPKDYNTAKNYF